jgi:glutamate decarboxylase
MAHQTRSKGASNGQEEADNFTTSVYGSHFATQDLPSSDMPETPMPPEIAYRMIKDELGLDNNPKLK